MTGPALNVGTDILEVARVRALLAAGRFERWFTPAERDYCHARAHPEQHFAARLAAKEAVFKALGLPGDGAIPWGQIEIVAQPRQAPRVVLHGGIAEHAARSGIDVRVSLSHCEQYATATAITVPAAGSTNHPAAGT